MNIQVTAHEALILSNWDKFCVIKGLNPYCLNEGLLDSNETFTLTLEEAKECGLLRTGRCDKELIING